MTSGQKPRLLLELRVDDSGEITLEANKQKVNARPIGEPRLLVLNSHPQATGEDPFTDREDRIRNLAPPLANAYSPIRSWGEDNTCDGGFYTEVGEENHRGVRDINYYQAIQYFQVDDKGIEMARKLIF